MNDECPISNDERMTNAEIRMTKAPSSRVCSSRAWARGLWAIRYWTFVILSSLVIGHWSFASAQPPQDIEKEMRPPSGIEAEPHEWWEDWPTIAMVVGVSLLGIAAGAGLALKLANRKKESTAQPRGLSPHRWALQELGRLEASPLASGGQFEKYHTELSNLMRRYIEQRFKLQATKQTTPEFLDKMKSAACLTSDQQALLRDFLERCDLVKFAGVTATAEQSQELSAAARRFVQQTGDAAG
jgi:Domain of unknown function (DUF4381)